MEKKAIIVVSLVTEANNESNSRIAKDIRKSLSCDWLKSVKKVSVTEVHHQMPNGKEIPVDARPS